MPELDGLEATRGSLTSDDTARILILPTFDLDEYRLRGPPRGSEWLRPQGRSPEQLLAAIRTIADGDALLSPAITNA